jgi:hypothetical protein
MVFFALSLQDQVDKYSSYVGVAAFLGLAALSLLYFSQARELKRLRDWAGRAPERARELEDRVAAQAETARRVGSATAAAARPQPAAAATAAGARSQTVSPAVPVAAPTAQQAHAAGAGKTAEEKAEDEAPDLAPEPAASAPGRKAAAVATAVATKEAGERTQGSGAEPDGDEADAKGDVDGDRPVAKDSADADGVVAKDAQDGDGAAAKGGDGTAAADEPAKPEPGVPPAGARAANVAGNGAPATPSPAPFLRPGTAAGAAAAGGAAAAASGATPRPAAMPARASNPSATVPPRRPVTLPSRRPAPVLPPPEPERRSRTSIAAFGGVIAVLLAAGAFVATQVLGGDEDPAQPDQANAPTATATGTPNAGAALAKADTTVAVFNGTTVGGLAAQTADGVESSGFKRGRTGDYTDQQLASSVIFYTGPARAHARTIGRQLSIANLKAIDSETQALAGEDADVVVVIGFDKAP